MWNPFKKSTKTRQAQQMPPTETPTNRVDELANSLQKEGRISELEAELKALDSTSLSSNEQESWWHLYGIVAFQNGRDVEALERFQEALKRFPESAQVKFSLGQQYIRTKEIEKGIALFRTCLFPAIPREYGLAEARYAYLWNKYDDGIFFIRPFFDAYKQLKILDDHFLYVRGLPFFGRWWAYLTAFSVLADDFAELDNVTQFVVANCHDYDFKHLQTELNSYRADRPELLIGPLERRLAEIPEGDFPTGYLRMNIAVAKARSATSIEDAEAILTSVNLTERDFPWLEDIRTLATAEIAHRFSLPDLEHYHAKAFLARQPMLFEPDIALNFHLLRYQEHLKVRASTR